jgi:tRNA(adenine34) deaminase
MAIDEGRLAGERGEVPVGAVLVDLEGRVLARDGNRTIELHDPSAHAEMMVLRAAGQKGANYRLTGTTLYVTLEPCVMCAGAMVHARIGRLVYGATDPKAGGMVSRYQVGSDGLLNHRIPVAGGLLAEECGALLRDFFRERRSAAFTVAR